MILFKNTQIVAVLLLTTVTPMAFAGHPFITDDTSTQDVGNHQLEANTDWSTHNGKRHHSGVMTYSYGALKNMDIYTDVPVTFSAPRGFNDVVLGAKWRFYEEGAASFALKPELIFPTGNQYHGNGAGRTSVALTLIGSYEIAPWAFYSNVGVSSNRYALPEDQETNERSIWRASTAVSYAVSEHWKVLVDVGVARNPERIRHLDPAYFLTGVVYAPTKDIDLDVGLKFGLNNAEVTRQVGVGVTWRF